MTDKQFPILEGGTIPWSVIAPFEWQAKRNHYQSLDELASRGGLAILECIAVLQARDWDEFEKLPIMQGDRNSEARRAEARGVLEGIVASLVVPSLPSADGSIAQLKERARLAAPAGTNAYLFGGRELDELILLCQSEAQQEIAKLKIERDRYSELYQKQLQINVELAEANKTAMQFEGSAVRTARIEVSEALKRAASAEALAAERQQEIEKLRAACVQTLEENAHLADGNNCSLLVLKRAISWEPR